MHSVYTAPTIARRATWDLSAMDASILKYIHAACHPRHRPGQEPVPQKTTRSDNDVRTFVLIVRQTYSGVTRFTTLLTTGSTRGQMKETSTQMNPIRTQRHRTAGQCAKVSRRRSILRGMRICTRRQQPHTLPICHLQKKPFARSSFPSFGASALQRISANDARAHYWPPARLRTSGSGWSDSTTTGCHCMATAHQGHSASDAKEMFWRDALTSALGASGPYAI